MNTDTATKPVPSENEAPVELGHFIKGEYVTGREQVYGPPNARFATPKLDLNALVWSRQEPVPAFDTPVSEIMDVLVQLGKWLEADPECLLAEALENSLKTGPLPRTLMETSYAGIGKMFKRESMEFQLRLELGGADVIDGWREIDDMPSGRKARIRAFPPRLLHITAGNAPGICALTIMRGALTKGVHLLKLPSNDLFTTSAILRGLAAIAPGHPLTRSFSAAYWRGGDAEVESVLFRPQFFDKIVAWGEGATINNVLKYVGPGLELVGFDPKTSISMIGREVFDSPETLADVAERAAFDATLFNQQACSSSRFQFIEGSVEQVDQYCELLQQRMAVPRATSTPEGPAVSGEMRDEIDGLRMLAPMYRVWGGYKGEGVVIRSSDPVGFHPDGKIVNVVMVDDLKDAFSQVNVC